MEDRKFSSCCKLERYPVNNPKYRVGGRGFGTVLRYDGENWLINFRRGVFTFTTSLSFLSPTNGWVTMGAEVWYFQNDSWRMDTTIFGYVYSIYFVREDKGWMVGEYAIDCGVGRGAILHYDGDKWDEVRVIPQLRQNYWVSVFFLDEDEGWIVGADEEVAGVEGVEDILYYKEGKWTVFNIDDYKNRIFYLFS